VSAGHVDSPVVEVHGFFYQSQADAAAFAFVFVIAFHAKEPVENMGKLIRGNTGPRVAYRYLHAAGRESILPGIIPFYGDADFPPCACVIKRIGNEVGEDFLEFLRKGKRGLSFHGRPGIRSTSRYF
jgi:hypothetical protein